MTGKEKRKKRQRNNFTAQTCRRTEKFSFFVRSQNSQARQRSDHSTGQMSDHSTITPSEPCYSQQSSPASPASPVYSPGTPSEGPPIASPRTPPLAILAAPRNKSPQAGHPRYPQTNRAPADLTSPREMKEWHEKEIGPAGAWSWGGKRTSGTARVQSGQVAQAVIAALNVLKGNRKQSSEQLVRARHILRYSTRPQFSKGYPDAYCARVDVDSQRTPNHVEVVIEPWPAAWQDDMAAFIAQRPWLDDAIWSMTPAALDALWGEFGS